MKRFQQSQERRHMRMYAQNFLINEKVADEIVRAAHPEPDETVLEIGPGRGVLTSRLAQKAKHVVALEKDEELVKTLVPQFQHQPHVRIVLGDALTTDLSGMLPDQSYILVANLPYNVATRIITNFVHSVNPPKRLVVMVQKEVADRMESVAPQANLLSTRLALYATVKKLFDVPAKDFQPKPKVDSSIIAITPHNDVSLEDRKRLGILIALGFAQPRKTLANNFAAGLQQEKEDIEKLLEKNGFSIKVRAEALTIQQWRVLLLAFADMLPSHS